MPVLVLLYIEVPDTATQVWFSDFSVDMAFSTSFIKWSFRSDSNWRPADYKSAALPTVLRKHEGIVAKVFSFVNKLFKVFEFKIRDVDSVAVGHAVGFQGGDDAGFDKAALEIGIAFGVGEDYSTD